MYFKITHSAIYNWKGSGTEIVISDIRTDSAEPMTLLIPSPSIGSWPLWDYFMGQVMPIP